MREIVNPKTDSLKHQTTSAPSKLSIRSQTRNLLLSLRPAQWIKNFFLYAALIFGGRLSDIHEVAVTTIGFISFSMLSSGVYIYNDIVDIDQDRNHPVKSRRPLPAGLLSVKVAAAASLVLAAAGLTLGFLLRSDFGIVLCSYAVLNVLYSHILKHVVILDVITIAAGFVLRVVGGAVLVHVPVSEWLVICTLLLSLFLGFSKRATELAAFSNGSNETRSVLGHYSAHFLDQMTSIATASTVMSYALYTISAQTVEKFGTRHLIYTLPFVLYGIFRYLYLTERKSGGEDPAKAVLGDFPLIINLVLWIVVSILIIYSKL